VRILAFRHPSKPEKAGAIAHETRSPLLLRSLVERVHRSTIKKETSMSATITKPELDTAPHVARADIAGAAEPVDAIEPTTLTPREAEVLRLLAQGLSDREIAEGLFLSPRTVGGHVTKLLTKLDFDSRTAAAVYAVRHGLA
jgi:DNA-binding NarL/FixJ family response regulator